MHSSSHSSSLAIPSRAKDKSVSRWCPSVGHSSTVSKLVRSRRCVHDTVSSSSVAGSKDLVLGFQRKLVERQTRAGREAELLLVVEHVGIVAAAAGAGGCALHGMIGALAVGLLNGELGVVDTW